MSESTSTTTPTESTTVIKVLLQKGRAQNQKGEVLDVIFQHFSKSFKFGDPANAGFLKGINEFRTLKFGEDIRPVSEANVRNFDGRETVEVVVNIDGTHFERASYKRFSYERWNPKNTSAIVHAPKWSRVETPTTALAAAFSAASADIVIDAEKVARKVATKRR